METRASGEITARQSSHSRALSISRSMPLSVFDIQTFCNQATAESSRCFAKHGMKQRGISSS